MAGVLVVGSVNVDHVVVAPTLPARGETVLAGDLVRHGGGKGANAAVAAARLGADVTFVGAVGDDDLGAEAVAALTAEGIATDAVARVPDAATGVALIVVDAQGDNQIAVAPGANGRVGAAAVRAALATLRPAAVLVSCEIPLDGVAAAAALGLAAGVPVVVNPAPVLDGLLDALPAGTILTPNAGEARALTGEADPERAGRALAAATGAPVVMTLGADGVLLVDGGVTRLPAARVSVVDTTGAGDAFNGALIAEVAGGARLEDAARIAVAAAGFAVGAAGARGGMPTRAQLAAPEQGA